MRIPDTTQPLPSGLRGGAARPVLRSFLVIDPERSYLDRLAADPRFLDFAPVLATPGADCERWIATSEWRFRAIFVSASVMQPSLLPLLSRIHLLHPATPVFVIHSGQAPLSPRERYCLAVHDAIARPASLRGYLDLIAPTGQLSDTSPKRRPRKPMIEQRERTEEDRSFVPVAAEEFLNGLTSFYDVYIRVPSGRYLKILNAKESLDPERVLNFIELGTKYLYLRRASQERCLRYCQLLGEALLQNNGISPEVKLLGALSSAWRLAQLMSRPEGRIPGALHLEYAQTFVSDLYSLAKAAHGDLPQARKLVETFLKASPQLDHALAVAVGAALLSHRLGIESPKPFQQLMLAALFHDLGLKAGAVESDDPEHGKRSAELLATLEGIDEVAVQAVALHHGRRDASGVPLFAEIIGLSDELAGRLVALSGVPVAEVLSGLERETFPAFSSNLTQAFRAIFI